MNFATSAPCAPGIPSASAPLGARWRDSVQAGTVIWALSLFMASPPFGTWSWQNIATSRAADYLKLCRDPLGHQLAEDMLAYRIATPLLAWLLHLPPVAALALPYLLSLCALIIIHRAMCQRCEPGLASAATIGVACSSTFHFAHGVLGYPDALTHLGSAIALIGAGPAAAGGILVGCLNDERAALALPFIALWRCPAQELRDCRSRRAWLALAGAAAPLVAGLAGALLVRHALKVGWIGDGLSTPSVYLKMMDCLRAFRPWLESWGVWFVNCLSGPGWLWLLVLPPCLSPRWRPAPLPAIVLTGAFLLVCASTLMVADVARSIGFAFPAALLGCVWLHGREPATARKLTLLVACLQVITPALWIYQRWQWLMFRPLPWELWLLLHR